ncbi:MAG: alpha/beta hydrolase [Alphaproteobacteria bacterium]|nr:alpha/beta hydrolase [Alphaproteobacteria bacterium]
MTRPDRRQMMAAVLALGALFVVPGGVQAAQPFASRRISVTMRGRGPDVVLIPGLGSAPSIWDGAIAATPGYRYHLVQVKGFAGTAAEGNATGPVVAPVAEEIARYIAAMGLKRPAIIGHSMGGTLAMMLAIRHPASVGKLMVVDMMPSGAGMVGGTTSGMGAFAGQWGSYFSNTKGGREMFRQLMGMFGPDAADNDPDVMAAALQDLAKIDLGPELGKIAAPMMVVYATPADAVQRATIVQRYATAYAGAKAVRLKAIGPSGHMIMFDQPARFVQEMQAFLRG